MLSIEKQVDISGSRQVIVTSEHSARMTLAERGGRAIMRVLSKDARVSEASAVLAGMDVDVNGKVVCTAVCEISGGEVVCLEYMGNFNFAHKAVGVVAPCSCDVAVCTTGVRVLRASGCEVVCEVDFAVRENFAVMTSESAVVACEGCYCEEATVSGVRGDLKVHNFTALAEMEVDSGVSIVLAQQFFVEVSGISARGGSCVCSGNIHGWVTYIDLAGDLKNQPCSFPFREEFSCGEADDYAVFARVGEHNVVCEVNEVRGVSVVTCEVEVEMSLWGYTAEKFQKADNFFSDKVELSAEYGEFCTSDFIACVQSFGKFSQMFDWPFDLPSDVCLVSARVASVARRGESGIFDCKLVCTVGASDKKFHEFEADCEIAFAVLGEGRTAVCDVLPCEVSARIVGGRIEISGRVSGNLMLCQNRCEQVVSSLVVGGEKSCCKGGFVMYRAENGETLLDVCGAIGIMPDALKSQNPNVVFPIVDEEKVVCFLK